MNFIILLTIIAFTKAGVITDRNCDGVIINNINYEKEVLKANVSMPYHLVIDYDTNTLFFSYTANTDETFKSAYINLKNNEFGIINGINGGFANAVDDEKHIVYLGGNNGIYKYDFNTKSAVNLGITNFNIWHLFYNNGLYFTTYPKEEVYIYKNGIVSRVPELKATKATLVAVDNEQNIFLSNSSGIFRYGRVSENIIKLGEYNDNGFAKDIEGKLYFTTPGGFYYINDKSRQIEKLARVKETDVYGMVIEADGHIIYAAEDSIVRLKPTKSKCSANYAIKQYEGQDL